MIWADTLGRLEYYLIIAFSLAYIFYLIRLFLIARTRIRIEYFNFLKKLFLRSTYILLIFMSLMGPSFGDVKKELKSIGKEIYFVIDASSSMNAYDVPPSRLERGKKEIANLLKKLNGNDKIGIIVFSGEPYLQCPLTYDFEAVNLYLQTIKTDALPVAGSNPANALLFAASKFEMSKNSTMNEDKVIILVSDGEAFEGDIDRAIAELKKNNIMLYTLGIGTMSGSKIPDRPGFKKDKNGNTIISQLDRAKLSSMAISTGGIYSEINSRDNDIFSLAESINKLKGKVTEVRKIDISSNKYYYFLGLAAFLILIDGLVTVNIVRL